MYHSWREVALSELDVAVKNLPLLQPQHIIEQFRESNCDRSFGFAIETQGLAGDMRDALQLLLCERRAMAGVFIEGGMITMKEKDIGDCSKRVVDFVSNDTRNTAHGGELLSLSQSFFGLQLGSDITVYFKNRVPFVIHRLAA